MTSAIMVLDMGYNIETMLVVIIILTIIIGVCLRQYGIRQGW